MKGRCFYRGFLFPLSQFAGRTSLTRYTLRDLAEGLLLVQGILLVEGLLLVQGGLVLLLEDEPSLVQQPVVLLEEQLNFLLLLIFV